MRFFSTKSADGTRLRLGRVNEEGRKDLLVVHGLAEHLGRYEHLAEAMADDGWRVTLVELRGHGSSEGQRGHADLWIRYVEDIQAAMGAVARPMSVLAHSMGGLATLSMLQHSVHPPVRSVALSNPLLGLTSPPSRGKELAIRLVSRIVPWLKVPNEVDPASLCRDPAIVLRYKQDPLVHNKVSVRWGREMMKALESVHRYAPKYRLPLLLLLGDVDMVCDPDASLRFAENYGGDSEIRRFPKLYHELFNEPEKAEVIEAMKVWLNRRNSD